MNKRNPSRFSIVASAWIFVLFVLYLVSIFFDSLLTRHKIDIDVSSLKLQAESRDIEYKRALIDDIPLRNEAIKTGYQSLIYPDLFDGGEWKKLAEDYSIAPLSPQPRAKLYFCNEGYGLIKYESDRFGFRNNDTAWNEDWLDVVIIGDSFAMGACVSESETIAGQLIRAGKKSINLATASNSPIHYASLIKIFAGKIKTHYLVVVFYPNDNIENEEKSIFNKYYVSGNIEYFLNPNAPFRELEVSENLRHLWGAAKSLLEQQNHFEPKQDENPSLEIHSKIEKLRGAHIIDLVDPKLKTLRSGVANLFLSWKTQLPYGSTKTVDFAETTCRATGCIPIIVYIPNSEFWRADARAVGYASALRNYAQAKKLHFLNMSEEIGSLGNSAYAIKGPHLSPRGYGITASKILSVMR